MKVNVYSSPLRAFDVQSFDVALGTEVRVELMETAGAVDWFANNDSILSISDAVEGEADVRLVKGTKVGSSIINIMKGTAIAKSFVVNVYDEVTVSVDLRMENERLKNA